MNSPRPIGWTRAQLGVLLERDGQGRSLKQGWSPQCEKFPASSKKEWAVLKTTAIQDGYFLSDQNKALPNTFAPKPDLGVRKGDLLITCAGPRLRCGVACLVEQDHPTRMISGKMYRFRADSRVACPEYLLASMRSDEMRIRIDEAKSGISDSGLNLTHERFLALELELPPVEEQHRIVAKIDNLSAKSKRSRDRLDHVPRLVERYKQAVLAAAFAGDLTVEWRKTATHPIPACEYVAKRQAERNTRIDRRDLGRDERAAQIAVDSKLQTRIDDVAAEVRLPATWCWAAVGSVFGVYVGATPSRTVSDYWNGSIPWVSSGEVAFCRIHGTEESITERGLAETSTRLHPPGTVLIGMIGQGRTRGQAAILEVEASNNQNCAAIRVSEAGYPPAYLYWHLWMSYAQTRTVGGGNNQQALNKERVQNLLLPIAPPAEAKEVVRRIEIAFAWIHRLTAEATSARKLIDRLDQAVLAKAFRGELVPQDAADEPASVLLERITAARNGAVPAVKRSGRPRRAALL